MLTCHFFAGAVAAVQAIVTLVAIPAMWFLLACSLLIGLRVAVGAPAQTSLIPALVHRADLPVELAINSVRYNLARVFGPLLGAAVVELAGFGAAFVVNAASFALFGICLTLIRQSDRVSTRTVAAKFRSSVSMLWRMPGARWVLLSVCLVSAAIDPVTTLVPAFVVDQLGLSQSGVSALVSSFGLGAVAAGLVKQRDADAALLRASRVGLLLPLGLVGFAVPIDLVMAMVCLAIAGFGSLGANTALQVRFQSTVPVEQLGRATAFWTMAFLGVRPPVALIDGALGDAVYGWRSFRLCSWGRGDDCCRASTTSSKPPNRAQ